MMHDTDPLRLDRDLWSWLDINLQGTARNTFRNVPRLQGFEAWRRVVVPLKPKTVARRHAMHTPVHNPPKVARLVDVTDALQRWDHEVAEYLEIGGQDIDEETKIMIALKILPDTTPASMMLALRRETTYENLKAALDEQITFLEDHGDSNRATLTRLCLGPRMNKEKRRVEEVRISWRFSALSKLRRSPHCLLSSRIRYLL